MSLLSAIPSWQSSHFRSSQSRATTCIAREDGSPQPYPHTPYSWFLLASLRLCVGHSQQSFMASPTHGTVFWVSPLSFAAIFMTWPIWNPLSQWDSMAIPTPLRRLESRNGASFPFQKVNQYGLGAVTRASGSTITGACFSIGICTAASIVVWQGVAPTRRVMSPGPISTSQQRLIHYQMMRPSSEVISGMTQKY